MSELPPIVRTTHPILLLSAALPMQNYLFTVNLPYNQMHSYQALCPLIWSWTRWFTAASHLGLSREGLGILGIPQSAKNIDNALSLTLGWGIDEWLEGHKSDSSGSAPCHSITYPLSSPIKCTRRTSLHPDKDAHSVNHTPPYIQYI